MASGLVTGQIEEQWKYNLLNGHLYKAHPCGNYCGTLRCALNSDMDELEHSSKFGR